MAERYGTITKVSPASFKTGEKLDVYVSFSARTTSFWEMSGGWTTYLEVRLNGLRGLDSQWHIGWEGGRTNEKISLGIMPTRTLVGTVELRAGGVVLDRRSLTYQGVEPAVPVPPSPPITPTPPAITPEPAIFTCPTCGLVFYTAEALNSHMLTHITPPVVTPEPEPTPTPIPGWVLPVVIGGLALVVLSAKPKRE